MKIKSFLKTLRAALSFAKPKDATDCDTCDSSGTNADGDQCNDCAGQGWY